MVAKGFLEWKVVRVGRTPEHAWEARIIPDFRAHPDWGDHMFYASAPAPVEALCAAMRQFAERMCASLEKE